MCSSDLVCVENLEGVQFATLVPLADALGVRVVQIAGGEGAPMGAALVAGLGVGMFDDLDRTAREWIKTGKATAPDRALAGHYAKRLARYERLLDAMNRWSES